MFVQKIILPWNAMLFIIKEIDGYFKKIAFQSIKCQTRERSLSLTNLRIRFPKINRQTYTQVWWNVFLIWWCAYVHGTTHHWQTLTGACLEHRKFVLSLYTKFFFWFVSSFDFPRTKSPLARTGLYQKYPINKFYLLSFEVKKHHTFVAIRTTITWTSCRIKIKSPFGGICLGSSWGLLSNKVSHNTFTDETHILQHHKPFILRNFLSSYSHFEIIIWRLKSCSVHRASEMNHL